jgi:hypothetical protein
MILFHDIIEIPRLLHNNSRLVHSVVARIAVVLLPL